MGAIDSVIQVNVTAATTAVATQSFAIPLILGPTVPGSLDGAPPPGGGTPAATQNMVTCSTPEDLLSAGYQTTDPEHVYAVALCSQAIKPAVFKVCARTGSNSVGQDLQTAAELDDSWYAVVCPGLTDAEIQQAAAQVESMTKLFVGVTATAAVAGTGNSDVGTLLKEATHTRTALLYSPNATSGIEAAWVGGQVAKAPGSSTWAYKTLAGIQADPITPSQASNLFGTPVYGQTGKSVNCYQTVGGVAVTQEGTTSDGGFIDTRIGIDSLRSVIKTNIYQAMVNNEKIPYTDAGAVIFESAIRSAIDTHVAYGFIDGGSPISVAHTPVASVSPTVRAQRIAPPLTFTCRAAGAQHAAIITGVVNV